MFSGIVEYYGRISSGTFSCNGAANKEVNRGVFRTLSNIQGGAFCEYSYPCLTVF